MWCKIRVQSHSFARGCAVFPTPFVKETILSPLCGSAPLSEILWLYTEGLFVSCLLQSFGLYVFILVTHPFVTVALYCVLKSENVSPPTLHFFKVILAIWTPLRVSIWMLFSIFIYSFISGVKGTDIKALPLCQGSHVGSRRFRYSVALRPPLDLVFICRISRNRAKALSSPTLTYPLGQICFYKLKILLILIFMLLSMSENSVCLPVWALHPDRSSQGAVHLAIRPILGRGEQATWGAPACSCSRWSDFISV